MEVRWPEEPRRERYRHEQGAEQASDIVNRHEAPVGEHHVATQRFNDRRRQSQKKTIPTQINSADGSRRANSDTPITRAIPQPSTKLKGGMALISSHKPPSMCAKDGSDTAKAV
jgi:hypothetical protein